MNIYLSVGLIYNSRSKVIFTYYAKKRFIFEENKGFIYLCHNFKENIFNYEERKDYPYR